MRSGLVTGGIVLMVIGAFFTFITFGLGIICTWPLILIGIIILIVGAILPEERTHVIQHQQPVVVQQQNPQSNRYCPSCGRAIPFDVNVCPYCGKNFRGP